MEVMTQKRFVCCGTTMQTKGLMPILSNSAFKAIKAFLVAKSDVSMPVA